MELAEFVRILRRDWAFVFAFVLLGCALGVGLTVATTPVYQASVRLFVATTSTSASSSELAQGNNFIQDRVQSYTDFATSPMVTDVVVRSLDRSLSPDDLAGKISADAPQDKILINIHVTDTDPGMAAKLANAVAAQFATVVEDSEKTETNSKAVIRLTVTHPAKAPTSPIKPNKPKNIGLGLGLGLLVGFGFVVARERLDNTVKSPADFEDLGVAVLGLVPFDKRTPKTPIAFRADPHSTRSEAYRLLRTNLQFISVDATPRVIAVTSAVPGEGKTTTALNLAAALAEGGYNVCLVEADLRRPNIATTLGLAPDVGFTTALIGKTDIDDVIQSAGRNLSVLTCGPVPPNPSELLITVQAKALLRHVADRFDFVIVDCAPLLPVADGSEVAALADATLLVHHAGKTTYDHAARSVDTLAKVSDRPVGVVLNMITRQRGTYDGIYSYYYSYRPARAHRKLTGREVAAADVQPAGHAASEEPAGRLATATNDEPDFDEMYDDDDDEFARAFHGDRSRLTTPPPPEPPDRRGRRWRR